MRPPPLMCPHACMREYGKGRLPLPPLTCRCGWKGSARLVTSTWKLRRRASRSASRRHALPLKAVLHRKKWVPPSSSALMMSAATSSTRLRSRPSCSRSCASAHSACAHKTSAHERARPTCGCQPGRHGHGCSLPTAVCGSQKPSMPVTERQARPAPAVCRSAPVPRSAPPGLSMPPAVRCGQARSPGPQTWPWAAAAPAAAGR